MNSTIQHCHANKPNAITTLSNLASLRTIKTRFSVHHKPEIIFPTLLGAGLIAGLVIHPGSSLANSAGDDERISEVVKALNDPELKSTLSSCLSQPLKKSSFSIGHRGAPFNYPEHTKESYQVAAKHGAGLVECDVTFTKDKELVCRHSQCDLATTTNILSTPLAEKCAVPPDPSASQPYAAVQCCTSDLTLSEFKSLKGKKDYGNKKARTLDEYQYPEGTEKRQGELLTHSESIQLFKSLGVKMIPELKAPQVNMPFAGSYSQNDYRDALVQDYIDLGVSPEDVLLQSFNLEDVQYWIANYPEFGKQAAWLDGRYRDRSFSIKKKSSWNPSMTELKESGVTTLAPPLWMLLTSDKKKQLKASAYAKAATDAGLELITWTLERSGSLNKGGGWYYQTVKNAIGNDGDTLRALQTLHKDVGVKGVFSDWPATTTFYANCMDIQ